jgi:hypothetical protein
MLNIWPTAICTISIIILPSPVTAYIHIRVLQEDRKMREEAIYDHQITYLRSELYKAAGGILGTVTVQKKNNRFKPDV